MTDGRFIFQILSSRVKSYRRISAAELFRIGLVILADALGESGGIIALSILR